MIINYNSQYNDLSTSKGMGNISTSNSYSIFTTFSLSSSVIKLIANPRWPNLPDLPILCKYVSEFFGKSKLKTTLTDYISIPLVNKSEETKHLPFPDLKL